MKTLKNNFKIFSKIYLYYNYSKYFYFLDSLAAATLDLNTKRIPMASRKKSAEKSEEELERKTVLVRRQIRHTLSMR